MKETHASRHPAVVVAGGGFGGLCAALRAQEDGASVAVIEKAEEAGGAGAWAVTLWCAADVDEWLKAQPGGDVELGGALVEQFHRGIGWLSEQGVSLRAVAEPDPYRFKRVIYEPVPDARAATEKLAWRFRARGGALFTDTELTGLIGGNGEPIAGVETSRGALATSAVVLATGGFQGGAELRVRYSGAESEHVIVRSMAQNTGAGLRSALAAGAQVAGSLDRFHGQLLRAPTPRTGLHNVLSVKPDFSEYCVLITLEGRRFDDEFVGDRITCHSLVRQPRATAIIVFDQYVRDNPAVLSQWPTPSNDRVESIRGAGGEVIESPSLAELARALADRWRIPPRAFLDTMEEHARACAAGSGGVLSVPRSGGLVPIHRPPYYAVRTLPGITFTYGGLKVNAGAQVLDRTGAPIRGLYAAGADCGGIYTRSYTGGTCIGLAYGLLAGGGAAEYVSRIGRW